jgi:hypothetical protein
MGEVLLIWGKLNYKKIKISVSQKYCCSGFEPVLEVIARGNHKLHYATNG